MCNWAGMETFTALCHPSETQAQGGKCYNSQVERLKHSILEQGDINKNICIRELPDFLKKRFNRETDAKTRMKNVQQNGCPGSQIFL